MCMTTLTHVHTKQKNPFANLWQITQKRSLISPFSFLALIFSFPSSLELSIFCTLPSLPWEWLSLAWCS